MTKSDTNLETAHEILSLTDPHSPMGEQYRLLFSKLDRICKAEGKTVIAFTSSVKGEGKTTTSSNLAVVAARDFKKRCLLIDADFKNPSIGNAFGIGNVSGLVDFMMDRCLLETIFTPSSIGNLTIIPVGNVANRDEMVPNLAKLKEILSKVRGKFYDVKWNESQGDFNQTFGEDIATYDYIFIDTPPLVPLFDANLISEVADAFVFVVRAGGAPKHIIMKALSLIDKTKVIGSVLNCAKVSWSNRAYEYGYSYH